MNWYQEITLIDQDEISPYFIWSKVYTQLLLLPNIAMSRVEYPSVYLFLNIVSMSKRKLVLGTKIRVFASSENDLQQLNLGKWLERFIDYVHITQPREVPRAKITGYAHYYRVNPRMSVEERIVHQAQRRNISLDQARQHFKQYVEQPVVEPYVSLKVSVQNEENVDRPYRLYIGKSLVDEARDGMFGTYGLSRMTTVPEF